jgi:hypothetical protein
LLRSIFRRLAWNVTIGSEASSPSAVAERSALGEFRSGIQASDTLLLLLHRVLLTAISPSAPSVNGLPSDTELLLIVND